MSFYVDDEGRQHYEHVGMARCGSCGEPTAPVLRGSVAEVEANPNIVIRCYGCATTEEAETITKDAAS